MPCNVHLLNSLAWIVLELPSYSGTGLDLYKTILGESWYPGFQQIPLKDFMKELDRVIHSGTADTNCLALNDLLLPYRTRLNDGYYVSFDFNTE